MKDMVFVFDIFTPLVHVEHFFDHKAIVSLTKYLYTLL